MSAGEFAPTDVAERFARAADLARRLDDIDYLADDSLATVAWLAMRLHRPLLLEGEPGTGKTALAEALAEALDVPLIRLQCYEGIDATQALYDWDFPRQILHLRAVEALGRHGDAAGHREGELRLDEDHDLGVDAERDGHGAGSGADDGAGAGAGAAGSSRSDVEAELFTERFLLARPVLAALRQAPAVLLVDEIDRADDEFEAFLLEVLSTWQVTIPELGTVRAAVPPVVVLTSNRTRELHDALKRRCLYQWIDHPGLDREIAIVRRRVPDLSAELAHQLVQLTQTLRSGGESDRSADGRGLGLDLVKPPGVAETIDWARALLELGAPELDVEIAAATLGVAIKHREDGDRVRSALDRLLAR